MSVNEVNKMKKVYALIISLLFLLTIGCSIDFTTTKGTFSQTTTMTGTQTTTEMDMEDVISAVYAKIYAELYDDIRAEIIADLSEEEFQAIYDDVMTDLYAKIDSGDLTLEAVSSVNQILDVALNAADSVVGVANLNAANAIESVGSGVIYKQTGSTYFVVTNEHVIKDGASFEIHFEDGTSVAATLLGKDALVDVAVLTFVSNETLTVVNFGDSER